jgi:aspartate kinase
MIIYKFGGASVKDAAGIRNLAGIVSEERERLVVVVSAFGKTTNALEGVLKEWIRGNSAWSGLLEEIYKYHLSILSGLYENDKEGVSQVESSFRNLMDYLKNNSCGEYDFEYDQVVSFGEIWSTIIVGGYLQRTGINSVWVDIRNCILTDDRFRDANVLWDESRERITGVFDLSKGAIYITQGFIGGTADGRTTTLGREGSDYTAAILGNILDADRVVVWKDVAGIQNADPKWMPEVTPLAELTYKEAVEMTFSGAKVIHPKTIKPLHNKGIPLFVRSFIDPGSKGTVIKAEAKPDETVPIYLKKENQILISILPRDFSFAMGDNLSRVFHSFLDNGIKVNLVQASAVSINVCVDDERSRVEQLINELMKEYNTVYNDRTEIITVRHYTAKVIEDITRGREILLEQRTRKTVRFVLK